MLLKTQQCTGQAHNKELSSPNVNSVRVKNLPETLVLPRQHLIVYSWHQLTLKDPSCSEIGETGNFSPLPHPLATLL